MRGVGFCRRAQDVMRAVPLLRRLPSVEDILAGELMGEGIPLLVLPPLLGRSGGEGSPALDLPATVGESNS